MGRQATLCLAADMSLMQILLWCHDIKLSFEGVSDRTRRGMTLQTMAR